MGGRSTRKRQIAVAITTTITTILATTALAFINSDAIVTRLAWIRVFIGAPDSHGPHSPILKRSYSAACQAGPRARPMVNSAPRSSPWQPRFPRHWHSAFDRPVCGLKKKRPAAHTHCVCALKRSSMPACQDDPISTCSSGLRHALKPPDSHAIACHLTPSGLRCIGKACVGDFD